MGTTAKITLTKCPKCKVRFAPGIKLKPYCEKCGFTFPVAKEPMSLKGLGIVGGILGLGLILGLAFFLWPESKEVRAVKAPFKSFLNAKPTEITTGGEWIRVNDRTTLADKKGSVVWLEFTTLKSASSSEKSSHFRRWSENFGGSDFSIITIFSGPKEEELGSSIRDVRSHFKGQRTPQLVLFDTDGTTFDAYGINRFPTSYLINKEGVVVWEGMNNQNLTAAEMKLKESVNG